MAGAKKRIQDLPKSKRPRERLVNLGAANLTSQELLAIILSSGTPKQNVLNLAQRLLEKMPLSKLGQMSINDLAKIKGIGQVKAGKILASLELGKRIARRDNYKKILNPEDVCREIAYISNKKREYLVGLYLNARQELLKKATLSLGGLNFSYLEPRDIFRYCFTLPCAFVILAHNHPSGDCQPTREDKELTKKLLQAGRILGIELVDHLIVASKDYFSFKEAGLIKE
jgi:DNA repair protein RadC